MPATLSELNAQVHIVNKNNQFVLTYQFLHPVLFISLLITVLAGTVALIQGPAIQLARQTIDICVAGPDKGLTRSHVKVVPSEMTCTDCSCGSTCTCCARYESVVEPYSIAEWALAGLYMLVASGGCIYLLSGRHSRLILSESGITFPVAMMPPPYKRTSEWSELSSVSFTSRVPLSEMDEDERLDGDLKFSFHFGATANLKLRKLKRADLNILLESLQRWASPFVMTQELMDLIVGVLHTNQKGAPEEQSSEPSFTAMWDDEMISHLGATTFVPLEKGARLQGGKYTILSLLGCGGLSAVYLAENGEKHLVVLKEAVLPKHVDERAKEKAKELFAREARLLLKLDHPAIAKVHDHIVENGRDYLVLEYIPGTTLRQLVKRKGPQAELQVRCWANTIAGVLQYLHRLDPPIIHRDITPDNLVMREDGAIFVIDFGAANEYVGAATGTLIGKQCYIAPEQFRGKAVPASDIYALGATLHFLLTGNDPEALSQSRLDATSVSPFASELVARCTALEVSERFESAEALIAFIESTNETS